jgi:hypothetical protein
MATPETNLPLPPPPNPQPGPSANAAPTKRPTGNAAAPGTVIQRIAHGPHGYGIGVNLENVDGRYAIGHVADIDIQRAISQVLGNGAGIENVAQQIINRDDAIQAQRQAPVKSLNGLKAQHSAPLPALDATAGFPPELFGKTAAQQMENRQRIDELLALRHQPVKVEIAHLNPTTPEAVSIVNGKDPPLATHVHDKLKIKPPAQHRLWAGVSHAPSAPI